MRCLCCLCYLCVTCVTCVTCAACVSHVLLLLPAQVILVGDFNIAAERRDVHKAINWDNLYDPSELQALQAITGQQGCNCTDMWRQLHPNTADAYTVWQERTQSRAFNVVRLSLAARLLCAGCGSIRAGAAPIYRHIQATEQAEPATEPHPKQDPTGNAPQSLSAACPAVLRAAGYAHRLRPRQQWPTGQGAVL